MPENNDRQSTPPGDIKFTVPKKWLVVLAVAILGGGGITQALTDVLGIKRPEPQEIKDERRRKHKKENERFVKINMRLDTHTEQIKTLDVRQTKMLDVQNQDIARREARRVTEKIRNRRERERQYDVIFTRNVNRLKAGKPPCSDDICSN
jgi:hypothetical protein